MPVGDLLADRTAGAQFGDQGRPFLPQQVRPWIVEVPDPGQSQQTPIDLRESLEIARPNTSTGSTETAARVTTCCSGTAK